VAFASRLRTGIVSAGAHDGAQAATWQAASLQDRLVLRINAHSENK
jgi:hypothetical protein